MGGQAVEDHIYPPAVPPGPPIQWACTSCDDEGVISGWQDSPFDLRRPRSHPAPKPNLEVPLSAEVAAALQDLRLLDRDCERLVFSARSSSEGIELAANDEDLDELIGYVAAEANHETDRRRQKRLDIAFAVLSDALQQAPGS
jgi:hypothetical protein